MSERSASWEIFQWLRGFGQLMTFASIYGSGLLGILVVQTVGPFLAMGAQMYTGNTEPHRPFLAWPLAWSIGFGLLPVPFLATKRWGFAMVSAVPLALLPWWQLYQLYQRAG